MAHRRLDENGRHPCQYYFDITLENDIRPGGQSSFLDLFLDVVLSPGGDVYILDRDELAAALSAGEISPAQYALALREAEALAAPARARGGTGGVLPNVVRAPAGTIGARRVEPAFASSDALFWRNFLV